jgi:hypothetical protein
MTTTDFAERQRLVNKPLCDELDQRYAGQYGRKNKIREGNQG